MSGLCGNPIDVLLRIKIQRETDFSTAGLLKLERTYRSDGFLLPVGAGAPIEPFGPLWRSSYTRHLILAQKTSTTLVATLDRADGQRFYFTQSGSSYVGDPDSPGSLTALYDAQSNVIGWSYESREGEIESYDALGVLSRIDRRDGSFVTLNYDVSGRLSTVTDEHGRTLQFGYDNLNRTTSVTLPDGNQLLYQYNVANAITSVQYPDTTSRQYRYENPNWLLSLTSIVDENGGVYATYTYDSNGWPLSSTHAGGAGLVQVLATYPTAYTDALGAQHVFTLQTIANAWRLSAETISCNGCASSLARSVTYDANGNVASVTGYNGNQTTYAYDSTRFLETQRIEAFGTSSARTTNTTWNAGFRVPDSRTVVNASNATESLTKWVYNTRGQVLSRCEIDPSVSSASSYTCGSSANAPVGVRQASYTYCEQAGVTAGTCPLVGLVLSADGARTDVSDVTTYAYYQTTDLSGCAALGGTCHYLGDLYQVTNALGQTTTYVSYDKNGHVTRMKDANGTVTDMSYHPRGWLLTRTVRANADGSASSGDAITTFAYDAVGQVTKITQPDGAYLSYTYDAAHRLTDITDNAGNTIHYTLDAAGNRTQEQTKDPTSTLTRALSRQYDQLSHLTKTLNAANAAVQIYQNPAEAAPTGITYTNGYDGNGNAIYSADANGIGTEQQYDGLNRLIKTLQDHAGTGTTKDTVTQYAYDARDNLRSVTDPDGLVTSYTYDGLNNLSALQSPDTGASGYTYDAAGNRTGQTDARGVTSTYSYDALNRLTGIGYPTTSLNVSYAYDQANATTGCASSYPQGRLTTISDSSGSTVYCYDRRGNVTSKKQTANGVVSTVGYAYTVADRVQSITYPSGAIVGYTRNALGQITAITYQANATASAQTLVASASYLPFGPLSQIGFGNGRSLSKTYDQDYAIDKVVSSDPNGLIVDATVDPLGNLVNASSAVNANPPTQSYQYDALYRLTTSQTGATPPSPLESYAYSKTGDRTSAALNGSTATAYAYTAGTHRLQSVGSNARSYDANGNTTSTNGNTFSYDDRNRLSALNANLPSGTQATYSYNGKGERVAKLIGTSGQLQNATTFVYGEGGQLLGEYANGNSQEYVYLDGIPVGIVTATPQTGGGTQNRMYYVETDQLGTPRAAVLPGATASADTIVWKWDYFGSTFGAHQPSVQTLTVSLRFPGQYFDTETGLNYNYLRNYDSTVGRYGESDPIDLAGGINTYSYTSSSPLSHSDKFGLAQSWENAVYPPTFNCACVQNCLTYQEWMIQLRTEQFCFLAGFANKIPKVGERFWIIPAAYFSCKWIQKPIWVLVYQSYCETKCSAHCRGCGESPYPVPREPAQTAP